MPGAVIRILALSDTHGRHSSFKELPAADVFLYAGDFTRFGNGAEEFALWFHRLPYKLKLLTLGNHERSDSAIKYPLEHWQSLFGPMLLLDRGVSARIDGRELIVFGLPHGTQTKKIAAGVDIVLSHEPPYRVLDRTHNGGHAGSEEVTALVRDARPLVHVFGHVHAQGGKSTVDSDTTHINAATRAVLFELSGQSVRVSPVARPLGRSR
ncbi:MAG: metallophosphatase domain-containing protein [Vulcanimicrobiaceae bacterium]